MAEKKSAPIRNGLFYAAIGTYGGQETLFPKGETQAATRQNNTRITTKKITHMTTVSLPRN